MSVSGGTNITTWEPQLFEAVECFERFDGSRMGSLKSGDVPSELRGNGRHVPARQSRSFRRSTTSFESDLTMSLQPGVPSVHLRYKTQQSPALYPEGTPVGLPSLACAIPPGPRFSGRAPLARCWRLNFICMRLQTPVCPSQSPQLQELNSINQWRLRCGEIARIKRGYSSLLCL